MKTFKYRDKFKQSFTDEETFSIFVTRIRKGMTKGVGVGWGIHSERG